MYEIKLFNEGKSILKAFYKYINSNRKIKEHVSKLTENDGSLTENAKEAADLLNKFFKSVFIEKNDTVELMAHDFHYFLYGENVQEPLEYK